MEVGRIFPVVWAAAAREAFHSALGAWRRILLRPHCGRSAITVFSPVKIPVSGYRGDLSRQVTARSFWGAVTVHLRWSPLGKVNV